MPDPSPVTTFLFTDIEDSSRLWESMPDRMRLALARHDAISRAAVQGNGGVIVKSTGDGILAAFPDPLQAVGATTELLRALADRTATDDVAINVRCGIHAGVFEHRDGDFFGDAVNRAARIMSIAHGGQALVSRVVADLVRGRLPADVSLQDVGNARLRGLAHAEHVFQIVHPALRAEFPALRLLEATPNNLPQQVTSFVGRERELAEVKELLGRVALLTLIGPGGIGKTRLSLQAAANSIDDYPDGVWFVEFGAMSDAQLVPQAVASVVGVREEAGRPVIEALVKCSKGRRWLLILDNCEHLVQACAQVATALLRSGPNVRIVASSREPLHVLGETTYQVPPLAVPDTLAADMPEACARYESVRLFVDRAVAAQPSFQVTAQNAAAVAEICSRLDGIPLALELAAARMRALTVETIASRLDDRFRLLTGGDRTALPRQQTLRALIDWSHELLTEPERKMFRRLAAFAGGFTLEAVEAVACGNDLGRHDALDLLTELVEKSLVIMDRKSNRYQLLETVRQYAQEKLAESGEVHAVRTRHLMYYRALAERARPELAGSAQGAWLARLDLERENLLSAHAWCDCVEDGAGLGLQLAYFVKPYWINRGLLGLGHRVIIEALARPGAKKRGLARCEGLLDVGQLDCWMGRYTEAFAHLAEGLAIARELDDRPMVAALLQPLGFAAHGIGDVGAARAYLAEALALAHDLGDKRELLAANNALAQLHRAEGELDAAEPLYEKTLTLARELGDRESIAIGLLNLAMVSIGRGSSERGGRMLLEVLDIVNEIGSKSAGQSALEVCAGLAARRYEWERAARLYGAAEAQAARTGLHRDPADEAFLAPLIDAARGSLAESAYAVAESAGRALAYGDALLEARVWLRASG